MVVWAKRVLLQLLQVLQEFSKKHFAPLYFFPLSSVKV